MTNGNHSIQRIHFKLDFASEKKAFHSQEAYLRYFKKYGLPALEALFDKYEQPDTLLRIDKLQLDLGDLPTKASEKVLLEKLLTQIESKLILFSTANTSIGEKVEKIPIPVSKRQALAQFLRSGVLNWKANDFDFQKEVEQLWEHSPEAFFETLEKTYRESGDVVLLRLSRQFDDSLLVRILEKGLGRKRSDSFLKFWSKLRQLKPGAIDFEQVFWISILAISLTKPAENQSIIRQFFQKFSRQLKPALISNFPELEKSIPKNWLGDSKEFLQKGGTDRGKILNGQSNTPLGADDSENNKVEPFQISSSDKANSFASESSSFYCSNAGVVILSPFLKSFFSEFDLLADTGKQFKDEKAQCKAVYLLYYLATGEWTPPEFNLTLDKLICGLPPDFPIPRNFELKEKEKAESRQLLKAVVKHWGALGNSSPDALRETFLQRDGKLVFDKTHWVLKIERKTLDVLLDKLPWNCSRIKLPWMKQYIRTEWN